MIIKREPKPRWKKPPVRLSKKEYREQKERLYLDQKGMCQVCKCWMDPETVTFHHTETGGISMKGDDDKGYLTHKLCHPPKVKKKY